MSPVAVALALGLVYLTRTRVFKADRERCRDQAILALLLMIYVCLPPVSTVIFRGIPCARTLDRSSPRC